MWLFLVAAGKALWAFVTKPSNLVIGALIGLGCLIYGFAKGYDFADDWWKATIARERAQQEEALREADEKTFKIIDRYETEKGERDARIQKLLAELQADGTLKRGALSPRIVRAINRALSGRP